MFLFFAKKWDRMENTSIKTHIFDVDACTVVLFQNILRNCINWSRIIVESWRFTIINESISFQIYCYIFNFCTSVYFGMSLKYILQHLQKVDVRFNSSFVILWTELSILNYSRQKWLIILYFLYKSLL